MHGHTRLARRTRATGRGILALSVLGACLGVCGSSFSATLRLPFACGSSYRISQDGAGCGWDGCDRCDTVGTHGSLPGALDFDMPAGTVVLAIAGGTVSFLSTATGPDDPCYAGSLSCCGQGKDNYVVVDHGDGTSALYLHINEALVALGDPVVQGQRIALSGSTGCSTGAHLHLQLQETCASSSCASLSPTFDDWSGSLAFCSVPESGNCERCLARCDGEVIVSSDCSRHDCGQEEALCSTVGGAPHCVSTACVASADEIPIAHDTCRSSLELERCDAEGAVLVVPCPSNTSCTSTDTAASCAPPRTAESGPPPPTTPKNSTAVGGCSLATSARDEGGAGAQLAWMGGSGTIILCASFYARRRRTRRKERSWGL